MKKLPAKYQIEILHHQSQLPANTRDIRILYIIDGSCTVTVSEVTTIMEKSDFLLVNSGDTVSGKSAPDTILAVISTDYYMLCSLLERMSVQFHLNSREETGRDKKQIRSLIQKILMAHLGNQEARILLECGYFYLLLQTIVTGFRVRQTQEQMGDGVETQGLQVIQYIHANYQSDISLNEIAERLFVSPSWVSRLFQKATGERFVSYVRKVRLEYAKQELVQSGKPITEVALDNGFSTPSVFNRAFRTEYGITPTEYRTQFAREHSPSNSDNGKREMALRILEADQKLDLENLERQVQVPIDPNTVRGWKKWENRILNTGPASSLTSASLQKQVLFLARRLNVEYVRIWNVFSPELMICGSGTDAYNFTFLDEILDFCVDHQLKLFLDLAQRKNVAMASERQEIFSREGAILFDSREAWLDALRCLMEHIRRRYHSEVVGGWIYELTFFLNDQPYYACDQYSTKQVWDESYEVIKSVIPSARVAGPGFIANPDQDFSETVIEYLLTVKHRPDLFTTMHFPYSVDRRKQKTIYQMEYHKLADRDFLSDQVETIRSILRRNGYQGELWITDWGYSLANRNYTQDSCFRAAYIVENALRVYDRVGAMGIFYASDLINAFADSTDVLTGSAGLLTRSGICKPAYYAYRFLSRLGKYCITRTEHCIATAEHPSDLRILCYNSKVLGLKYYLAEENTHRPAELEGLFANMDPLYLELIVRLPSQESVYVIRQESLNTEKGSILGKWIKFGCSNRLSRRDLEYLERSSIPEITAERITPIDGTLNLSLKLAPNEIRMITITKE